MNNIYVSSSYKHKIINLLLKSKDFIKLISPKESNCPNLDTVDVLLGGEWIIDGKKWVEQGYVFDHDFVNDSITDKKTFVFVDTDIPSIDKNMFLDFSLYVFVFTDKDLVKLTTCSSPTAKEAQDMGYFSTGTYGNRIDILCDCIDRILNGTDELAGIGDVQPAARNYLTTYRPNAQYYGKCLHYQITNYNTGSDDCGI